MQLFVHANSTPLAVDVTPSTSIEDLKASVAGRVQLADFQLTFEGRILDDLATVEDYSIPSEANLFLTVPVKGGKVHGSLARAGKVRGQTPKVEKQDKKKKQTGRAKRRIQYNRRFVNTVVGMGKKKGPNSNSK